MLGFIYAAILISCTSFEESLNCMLLGKLFILAVIFLKILYVSRVFQTSQVSTSSYRLDVWPTNLIDQSFKEKCILQTWHGQI